MTRAMTRKKPPIPPEPPTGSAVESALELLDAGLEVLDPTQEVTAVGAPDIPMKWRDRGVVQSFDPTPVNRLRLWVTGFPGTGKTWFLASNPDALILDMDDSVRDVSPAYRRASSVAISDGHQMMDLIKALIDEGQSSTPPFKHICLDTIDKFIDFGIEYLTDKYNESRGADKQINTILEKGDKGAGWQAVYNWLSSVLYDLYGAGYGWTCCGHIARKFDDATKTPNGRVDTLITPKTKGVLYREAQLMIELYHQTVHDAEPTGKMLKKKRGGKTIEEPQMRLVPRIITMAEIGAISARGVDIKARHLAHLPEAFQVRAGRGWQQLAKAWTGACDAAAAETLSEAPPTGDEVPW